MNGVRRRAEELRARRPRQGRADDGDLPRNPAFLAADVALLVLLMLFPDLALLRPRSMK
jgi:hypothetical protein